MCGMYTEIHIETDGNGEEGENDKFFHINGERRNSTDEKYQKMRDEQGKIDGAAKKR